jgi:aldehyde dehydrogenase (NAD+)
MPKPRDRARFRREPEEVIASTSPATGEFLGSVRVNTPVEVRAAVARAREAAASWAAKSFEERAQYLKRANDYIFDNLEAIADIISRENGKPRTEAKITDLLPAIYHNIHVARHGARVLADRPVSMPLWNLTGKSSYLRRSPWGVLGIISPWNYPFGIPMTQITMALAAGNTVVLKPASLTPLSALRMAEIIAETGLLPPGVLNLVTGPGNVVGSTLTQSPLVDKIAFTGSTEVGREIMRQAAGTMKKVTLELGGKSPNILLDDAELEVAVDGSLWAVFMHAGQACESGTRLFVPDNLYDEFMERLVDRASRLVVGLPADGFTDIGPLISRNQLERVERYVQLGIAEGATPALLGQRPAAPELANGHFLSPTIFTDVRNDMRIAQEEIFGPVLCVIKYDRLEDAIRMANDTIYGLAAGIWSADVDRAVQAAAQIRAGTVWINDYHMINAEAPFGGYKQSGIGRELGTWGLLEYTETKHVHVDLSRTRAARFWYDIVAPRLD